MLNVRGFLTCIKKKEKKTKKTFGHAIKITQYIHLLTA